MGSLPFLERPAMLDGTMPGDRGFDPFNFASNENALEWYENAEIKHARLAMLAAAGWPISELFHGPLAHALGMKSLLVYQDRVPSLLNHGLDRISPVFWAASFAAAFSIESFGWIIDRQRREEDDGRCCDDNDDVADRYRYDVPGDLGFDPLDLSSSSKKFAYHRESELFRGRLAMLAITGFAVQEWF